MQAFNEYTFQHIKVNTEVHQQKYAVFLSRVRKT